MPGQRVRDVISFADEREIETSTRPHVVAVLNFSDRERLGGAMKRLSILAALAIGLAVSACIEFGTGFVVSREGYILTNYHVVEGCRSISVGLDDGEKTIRISARDAQNDLALLKSPSVSSTVAIFRSGRGVRAGDSVVAIGFPLRGLGLVASEANVTTGTISALAGPGDDTRLLQITVPVQVGNSGVPLLDGSGNVVGVIFAKLDAIEVANVTGDIPQNITLAINARVAQAFLDANGVDYQMAPSTVMKAVADIGEQAKAFTVPIECNKPIFPR